MNNVYERWKGADFMNPMLFIILLMLILISLSIGTIHLGVLDVARIMFTTFPFGATSDHKSMSWVIVELVRLPRILLATLCGMSLSLSGAVMQGVFRNPLVGPEIIGVSSGAALGGVIAIILFWPWFGVVGLAFAFGLVALLLVFIVGGVSNRARTLNLVLAGVIVSGFCGALVGLAETLANPATILPNIVYWLLGSFMDANYAKVAVVGGVTAFAGTALLILRWRINLLSLGDEDARSLGVNAQALRWVVLALVAVLVAAQVSVSGGVGWVGLIIPHLARRIVGPEHTKLLPAAALLGGIYLLAMDDIARGIAAFEIPIGLITSVIGTPIFAFIFWRTQSPGWSTQ